MPMLDQRERALEQAFAHEEESRFRALAQRNRLFGQWAVARLGYEGANAEDYIRTIVDLFEAPARGRTPDDGITARVADDFARAGLVTTVEEVRCSLAQFEAEAAVPAGETTE